MKILVTGFEPFGGESRNPAAEAVELLPDTLGRAEIVKLILPVVRGEAPELLYRAVKEHRPHVVLSVGQAGGRSAVSVERVAVNLDDYRIGDNAGNQPVDEPVVPGGPDAYLCPLPVKSMVKLIRGAGVPAEVSLSAGTYVCNHLFYSACHMAEREFAGMRAGFIHIPYLPAQVTDKPGMPSMDLSLSAMAIKMALMAIVMENEKNGL